MGTFQKDEEISMSAVLHRIIAFLEMSQIEREGTREKQREREGRKEHTCVCIHA